MASDSPSSKGSMSFSMKFSTKRRRRRSSPGDRLSFCNYHFSISDKQWSSRGVPGTYMSISYLREAIDSLDCNLTKLMNKRRELVSRLEHAVRTQSPVLRLPCELLSSIFVIGVLRPEDEDSVMISTLMLVCRQWAQVALKTPVLWSRITITPHHSLEKVRRQLERSKTSPLHVTIGFGPLLQYTANISKQLMLAMDIIRPVLCRTKSFRLSVPNRSLACNALLRCQENAPQLEVLSIRIFHSIQDDSYSSQSPHLFNGCTPRLHSCSLTSFNFGWDSQLVSRLRVLKLDGYFNTFQPSTSTLIGFLRESPNLEKLVLRNMSSVNSENCCTSPEDCDCTHIKMHLRQLVSITFYCVGISLISRIMRQIVVPNLAVFEMSYLEDVTPILNSLYAQSLIRLPLRHLRVEACLFNEIKFLSLLRSLGSLEILELVDNENASSILLKGLSSSEAWVCPRLEELVLDGCTTFGWDSLRNFIESRLPTNPSRTYVPLLHDPIPVSSRTSVAITEHAWPRNLKTCSLSAKLATGALEPQPVGSIDVTRCSQISNEMVQWLRMYVKNVRPEAAKGVWDENLTPYPYRY